MKTIRSMVLEKFNEPLVKREFSTPVLKEGELLVKILAAGVCGSDIHMWKGKDPRIILPIILGHEGIGIIEKISGSKKDFFEENLVKGDFIIWDRGVTCGKCHFCTVKNSPYLCPDRKTYGISFSSSGCYSEYIHLLAETKIIKLKVEDACGEKNIDPAVLVSASCSGATAAHTIELANIKKGSTVIIQGPGPIGIFMTAFALDKGADKVIVIGTEPDRKRLKLCKEFGATDTLVTGRVNPKDHKLSADVVIECTGSSKALNEGLKMVSPGGIYLIPGIATPTGDVPFNVFENIARKNVRIQGVWVSDTSHLYEAVKLILSKKYPFEKLITHRFPLDSATEALKKMDSREALKAVLIPE